MSAFPEDLNLCTKNTAVAGKVSARYPCICLMPMTAREQTTGRRGRWLQHSFLWNPGAWGFPGSSDGEESACNAGDPGSIPGSGRSTGEGIGYSLQYSWASLVAQLVKESAWNVGDLGLIPWEDPLEKGKAALSSILAWRIPWTIQSMGLQRVGHDWMTFTSLHTQTTNL